MKQFIVDAFTEQLFHGNPAAVCVLEEWLSEKQMRLIAAENNLSETAFTVKSGNGYELRWFTPGEEVSLCGHATLGTAYFISLLRARSENAYFSYGKRRFICQQTKRLDFDGFSNISISRNTCDGTNDASVGRRSSKSLFVA